VYKNWFGIFLRSFPGRKPSTITKNEIMEFLTEYKKSDRWSATTQNQLINAIKFFYEKVINRPREMYELPRAQKPFRIPSVFAGGWFTLFAAVAFPQHKMIF
jgi:site-specific recombinase XerD